MPNDLVPVPLSGRPLTSSQSGPQTAPALDLFDPAGLGPLPGAPLIPESIRRRRHVFVPTDTRFRKASRFLQMLWREDRNLPIGSYTDQHGKARKLGSRLTPKAGEQGANLIDPDLLPVFNRALIYRELGAVCELDRLKNNLLSSQALCFNAFAPLACDPALTTRVLHELLPGLMRKSPTSCSRPVPAAVISASHSGVLNPGNTGVGAPDWRPRYDEQHHDGLCQTSR